MRIILVVASLMIIVGVILMMWVLMTRDDRNVINVSLIDGNAPVKFEELSLVPGDECSYTIKLAKASSDKFDLRLDFVRTGDGTLEDHARVKIVTQGDVVYDDLLADAIENATIHFAVDFEQNQNTEFQIVYYLPLDVGNEAKNAEAKFELILSASNE
jgi:hypothetical protein